MELLFYFSYLIRYSLLQNIYGERSSDPGVFCLFVFLTGFFSYYFYFSILENVLSVPIVLFILTLLKVLIDLIDHCCFSWRRYPASRLSPLSLPNLYLLWFNHLCSEFGVTESKLWLLLLKGFLRDPILWTYHRWALLLVWPANCLISLAFIRRRKEFTTFELCYHKFCFCFCFWDKDLV